MGLKFKQIILFSKILKKMNVKSFTDELDTKTQKLNLEMHKFLDSVDEENKEEVRKYIEKDIKNSITMNVFSFIGENISLIQSELEEFLSQISDKKIDEVGDMEIPEIWECLKKSFKDGIPDEAKTLLFNELKKTK